MGFPSIPFWHDDGLPVSAGPFDQVSYLDQGANPYKNFGDCTVPGASGREFWEGGAGKQNSSAYGGAWT